MTPSLATSGKSIAAKGDRKILCFYVNRTSQLQVIRLMGSPASCFERVVFPGQRLMFEAVPEATLKLCTEIDEFFIPCQQLCVSEF